MGNLHYQDNTHKMRITLFVRLANKSLSVRIIDYNDKAIPHSYKSSGLFFNKFSHCDTHTVSRGHADNKHEASKRI